MKRCWVKQSGWRIAAPPILLRFFIPADTGRCGIWPDPVNAALLEEFVAQDKPVAAVCHGPAALRWCGGGRSPGFPIRRKFWWA